MALQSSGPISLDQINIESAGSQVSGTQINIDNAGVRALIARSAGVTSSFSDFYGAEVYPTTGGEQNTGYNYAGGSLANGTGTLHYTIGSGGQNNYTTTSRTIWVGFVNGTDSENIDFIANASTTNLRCKVDLIRAQGVNNFDFVRSGNSGTAGKMYKDTNVSTSDEIIFEGSVGSSGNAWGSGAVRWPIRIMADAGITFKGVTFASGRDWQFRNTTRYTNVSSVHFDIAFAQGVQG